MPFFVARVVREYGMGYVEVLQLPLVTFWSFNRQVDRLRAEQDQRALRIAIAGNSESVDHLKEVTSALERELATPIRVEKQFNEEQFEALRQKFKNLSVSDDAPTE